MNSSRLALVAQRWRRHRGNASAVLLLALLSACAVGPDYHEPRVASPDEFLTRAGDTSRAVERDFWRSFADPTLDALIERALLHNHDVRIAITRLREARALRGEASLDLVPTVTQDAEHTRARASERQLPVAGARDQDYYETSFDAFWELDFFGRVRRHVEAQEAQLQAAEAGVDHAQVSVTAEVARNYFELRGAQARLGVAQRNASNQRETLQIVQARLDGGRGTQLDVARAVAQLEATLASIPELEADIVRTSLRLGVLVGDTPAALVGELARAQPVNLPELQGIGTPEALLRRRPDIRIAERQLAAATARIGVAVGDLFPRISFVGFWGFDAAHSSDLGERGSETYGFGPSIHWAAFDLGRVQQRIKQREAAAQGALAAYEPTVVRALEETDANLTDYAKARIRQAHLQASALASREAAVLARSRFDNGVADFLTVLDAERSVLEAEDRLSRSETQTATALIATYKALGGGFRPLDRAAQR